MLKNKLAYYRRKKHFKLCRLWLRYYTEPTVSDMFSAKKLVESILVQGRKLLLHRPTQGTKFIKDINKLNSRAGNQQLVRRDAIYPTGGGTFRRFLHDFFVKVGAPSRGLAASRTQQIGRLFGSATPIFSLVGITLSSLSPEKGLVTVYDEIESLCDDIREAVSKVKKDDIVESNTKSDENTTADQYSFNDFHLGPMIDKGCNAVVYAANYKTEETTKQTDDDGSSRCSSTSFLKSNGASKVKKKFLGLSMGRNKKKDKQELNPEQELINDTFKDYSLAVKMMFNYEAESNFGAILSAMYREILPASKLQIPQLNEWNKRFPSRRIPRHANIVDMPCVFVDRVPMLENADSLYPNALPKRLHAEGFGRNMTLFCVMKRYDCTLEDYLNKFKPDSKTSLLLLTQILEALTHLESCNVAHRDLKLDNILLSLVEGCNYPHLVLTDFGCCLSSEGSNLRVPFPSYEADPRQGNAALMAPEVKNCRPGFLQYVDYSKNDVWAAGFIALCLFNCKTKNFPDEAPKFSKNVSTPIRHLILDLLKTDPNERPSARLAATICQLSLWAPSKWLSKYSLVLPTHYEVAQWLLCLSTKILCDAKTPVNEAKQVGAALEYQVVSSFLNRIHYSDVVESLKWLRS